ncbi:MAG TPA: hypothetical protein VKL61_05515 [Candidatus Polarisedimenticolia bacterium]|nr:hypothetical protein [Candidatus Polarisedimenticolia bacterium]
MKGPLEVFRKLEREVRTPREKLPIDAFLPSLDSLPTDFPDPPPSRLTVQVREMGNASDMEQEKRERRRQRRTRKPAAEPAAPKNIEEEINEFINRDKPEGNQEEDYSDFLGGFDPSEIPEK